MNKGGLLIFAFILLNACVPELLAQYGYLNSDSVLNNLPGVQKLIGQTCYFPAEMDTVKRLERELSELYQEHHHCRKGLSEDSIIKYQIRIHIIEREIDSLIKAASVRMEERQLEKISAFQDFLFRKTKAFCNETGLAILFEKQLVLYGPEDQNYTQRFIDFLKENVSQAEMDALLK